MAGVANFTAPPALSRGAFCALEYKSVATLLASWAYSTAGPCEGNWSVCRFQTIALLTPLAETEDAGPGKPDISAAVDVGDDESTPFAMEKDFRWSLRAQM